MDHHHSPLGHLACSRPLSFAERAEVETLSNLWRVGDGCASLVLVAATSLDRVVVDLRWIVRHFCRPRELGLQGVVVLETSSGLYAVTAAERRIRSRLLGPAVAPGAPGPSGPSGPSGAPGPGSAPATAECRVIHLDQHRHRLRTAPRDRPPGRPGEGPDGDGWSS